MTTVCCALNAKYYKIEELYNYGEGTFARDISSSTTPLTPIGILKIMFKINQEIIEMVIMKELNLKSIFHQAKELNINN